MNKSFLKYIIMMLMVFMANQSIFAVVAVSGFSPSSGCSGNTSVIITGTDFMGATAVTFGGTPALSFVVNNATQITAIVGNGTTGAVSVTTPLGNASSAGIFTVNLSPAVTITQSPANPAPCNALLTAVATGGGGGVPPAAGNRFYIRDYDPWWTPNNTTAMDAVFGPGNYTTTDFASANPATLFVPGTQFVFLEGSDGNATALDAYVNANISTIENWVNAGGRLFLNSAPNQGGNMNWGFGGVTLDYNNAQGQVDVDPAHPIVTGPFTPAGAGPYTGNSYSHANIQNGGTDIITGGGVSVLTEKVWGSGLVLFGGITSPNFHGPQPNAQNLWQNIISYTATSAAANPTYTYLWQPGGAVTSTMNAAVTGIYTVTASAGSCSATSTVNVIIGPPPAAPTSVIANPASICSGGSTDLSAVSVGGNYIFWYTVPSGGSPIGYSVSGANFPVSPAVTTTYYASQANGVVGSQTFNYSGSIQNFVVPAGVTSVTINAKGGQGGAAESAPAGSGGLGADMTGTFSVTPGQILKVLVGQQGGGDMFTGGAGGGGGSFVTDISDNPMIIAGGGGGRHGTLSPVGMDAVTTNNGVDGYSVAAGAGSDYGVGGTGGNGATNAPTGAPHAGNGGGLLTDGQSGYCGGSGASFIAGGTGGYSCGGGIDVGGFGGGGGGGYNGAGGGGGYSGGGGSYHTPTNGGGGGSFNNGTSQSNTVNNTGDGQVVISWLIIDCESGRAPLTVTVNPVPAVTASASPAALCAGSSSVLTGSNAATYVWNPGGLAGSPSVSPAINTTYTVIGTDGNGCTGTSTVEITVSPSPSVTINQSPANPVPCGGSAMLNAVATGGATPPPAAGDRYYIRDNDPWGTPNNNDAMNAVFGGSYTTLDFGSANPATVFVPGTQFVFLEGSDDNAYALDAYINTNISTIENWVNAGGRLFLNSAPNQGGNMNWGFGGVVLDYNNAQGQVDVDPAHPIVSGPFTPAGAGPYTGSSYSHANIQNGGTDIITGGGVSVLTEKVWGAGLVLFGGITSPNFHGPQPNAQNLWQNIISYVATSGGAIPVYSYSWQPGGAVTSTMNAAATGIYTVTVSVGSCSATSTVSVVMDPPPAAPNPVTATPASICIGGSSDLNAVSAGNTIDWFTVPSGGVAFASVPSGMNVPVTPAVTTTYYAERAGTPGAVPGSQTFNYTGSMQTFIVPAGVTSVTIDAYGAQGGGTEDACNGGILQLDGGLGGSATGTLTVTPGQTLNIFVGEMPATSLGGGISNGGYNGGGPSGQYGGPGGGASDVRVGGIALGDRVIVAGGGGGGNTGCSDQGEGGVGGGLTGGPGIAYGGYIPAGGGTQGAGGAAGSAPGAPGALGVGAGSGQYHEGAGGGGYYGGGSAYAAGGGGGSSYIGGVAGGSTTSGVQSGHGMITITWAGGIGCPSSRVPVTVTVNPIPTVTATATPNVTCNLTSVTPNGGGAATYVWSGGLTDNMPFVATSTATYTVTGTDGGGCTATSTVTVTVNPASGVLAPATSNQSQDHGDDFNINYYDGSCDLIATVDDGAAGNILGLTTSTVNVDATAGTHNGQPFVRRWYQITPTSNGSADVILYINQSDFDDYNAAVVAPYLSLPTSGNNADPNVANIRITKNDDAGLGNNPIVITPTVNWNGTYWELSFNTPSFSQFRVHSVNPGNVPLPATVINFTGTKLESSDKLSWTTASEQNNAYFNLQHSTDGISFKTIAKVNSKAANGNSTSTLNYTSVNDKPALGHNYYRLQQVDIDQKVSVHAQIVDLIWGANGSSVSIYPNPTTDILNVDLYTAKSANTTVKLLDMSGRVVKQIQAKSVIGMNNIQLSMGEIAGGVYTIQVYENNTLTHTSKMRKND